MAIGWQIFLLRHQPFDLGLLGLVLFLPQALLAFPAGFIADRFDRRLVCIVCVLVQALTMAMFAWLAHTGTKSLGVYLAVAAVLGTAYAIDAPSERSLLATIVHGDNFLRAQALTSSISQFISISSPALGGALLLLGTPVAFDWGYFAQTIPTFPASLIAAFVAEAKLPGILGDRHASGTAIIAELRDERLTDDAGAFDSLLAKHDAALRRVARTFVRTPSAAEDVVQETWLAVIRGLDGFEGRSSLRTWIFQILINRARTYAVRDARAVPFSALEEDEGPSVDPDAFGADGRWSSAPERLDADPERSLLSAQLREQLAREIEQLPERQRAVVTLRDVVGFSAAEVAALLDLSEMNQRVLLHRGRSRIRSALASLVEEVA